MDYMAILVIVVFFVAIWNTSVGVTGGITFAAMAMFLPPFAVIPIHAMVESVSSLTRTIALRNFVSWKFVPPFVIGGVAGCMVGVPLLDLNLISEQVLQIILGVTILGATWVPLNQLIKSKGRSVSLFSGLGTTFLTLFIGATGSLVSALVHQNCKDQREVISTSSACMFFQHAVKIVVFGIFGFSFTLYGPLVVALLIASIIGTWIGRKVLIKVPQTITKPMFKGIVTILGVYVVGQGVQVDQYFHDWNTRTTAEAPQLEQPLIEKAALATTLTNQQGGQRAFGANVDDVGLPSTAARAGLAEADKHLAELALARDNVIGDQDLLAKEQSAELSQAGEAAAAATELLQGKTKSAVMDIDKGRLASQLEATETVLAIIDRQAAEAAEERDALAEKNGHNQERITMLQRDLEAARRLIAELNLSNEHLATEMDQLRQGGIKVALK